MELLSCTVYELDRDSGYYKKQIKEIKKEIKTKQKLFGEPVLFYNDYYVLTQGKTRRHSYLYHDIYIKRMKKMEEKHAEV